MKLRIFMSYPMNGKDYFTMESYRSFLRKQAIKKFGTYIELVDNSDCVINAEEAIDENAVPLLYLGEAIRKMATCHFVIFHPYWTRARGCQIEREVAKAYGLPIVNCKEIIDREKQELIKYVDDVRCQNVLFRCGITDVAMFKNCDITAVVKEHHGTRCGKITLKKLLDKQAELRGGENK